MYEAFYGFKEKPFSMLPDPGFLYLSKKHQAALTLLEYGLLNHVGFCVITGEAGAGKTTILRALLDRIGDDVTVGLITNTHQSFGGLLDWVLSAFDLHRPNLTHVEMHQIFMEYLIEEYANNRSVMLIVDEAQNMKPDSLEELRMLSNVNSAKDQLMQVILAGQPALKEMLRRPELMQFAQRIAVDFHLEPLGLVETCGYIQHRLVTAGAQKDVFTPAACERIHCYSGGTPRLINLLCETVLVYGFADQREMIDVDLVDEMVIERMKDSVVPIVNRDAAKIDNTAASKELEKDFPWIQPRDSVGETRPDVAIPDKAQQAGETKAGRTVAPGVTTESAGIKTGQKVTKDNQAAPAARQARVKAKTKVADTSSEADRGNKKARAVSEQKAAINKIAAQPPRKTNKKLDALNANQNKSEARNQVVKYGAIAVVFALALIAFALLLDAQTEIARTNNEVESSEAIELQKQRRREEARIRQLQIKTEQLKQERDVAIAKAEQERLAKQEAEKLAAEKAALAVKAAEDQRRLEQKKQIASEEKKRIAEANERKRLAKQKEAREKAEARAREAASLEEERRLMRARFEKEKRLIQEQEARRLELEWQEKQRQELLAAERKAQQEALAKEEAAKAAAKAEAESKTMECSGPTARFKAGCR